MRPATPSDLERVDTEEAPPAPVATRPETARIRSRLDDVMTRLRGKLERINGQEAQAVADNLDPKATRMARDAFSPQDLELEEEEEDHDLPA